MKACPTCGSAKVAEAAMLPSHRLDHATCWACNFTAKLETWNAMLRPSDIVAARIEGLREGFALAYDKFEMKDASRGYDAWQEPDWSDAKVAIIARIAELEAAAPEVSETRAKAEAFDELMALLLSADESDEVSERSVGLSAALRIGESIIERKLAEAKRKGAGT